MVQMMPLPHTDSCFSKIQIGFTFALLAYLCSPRQRPIKYVCGCVCYIQTHVYLCVCFARENTLYMLKQQKAVGTRAAAARTIVDRLVCNFTNSLCISLVAYYVYCMLNRCFVGALYFSYRELFVALISVGSHPVCKSFHRSYSQSCL